MAVRREKGFTLIELLVVIAIIGILAAMLFPVFARAPESARKIQCLSNVKNIAMAVQMYLSDYDRFPPSEHRPEVIAYFTKVSAAAHGCSGQAGRATWSNPFIRWPVVFDEYIKNRDVWHCPSTGAWDPTALWIVPDYDGDWFKYLEATEGSGWTCNGWSAGGSPCGWAFPPGWGGDVTDSVAQQAGNIGPANHPGCFDPTVGCTSTILSDQSTSSIGDAANCVVCGDATNLGVSINGVTNMLYTVCRTGCGEDWSACPQAEPCSISLYDAKHWATDATLRNSFTRHMGGSNFGFADGHAKWWPADAAVAAAPYCNSSGVAVYTTPQGQALWGGLCP